MAKFLKITQVRSPIRRIGKQRLVLESIGLGKMKRTVFTEDTPTMRGVVNTVPHLVEWEVVDQKTMDAWFDEQVALKTSTYTVIPAELDGEEA